MQFGHYMCCGMTRNILGELSKFCCYVDAIYSSPRLVIYGYFYFRLSKGCKHTSYTFIMSFTENNDQWCYFAVLEILSPFCLMRWLMIIFMTVDKGINQYRQLEFVCSNWLYRIGQKAQNTIPETLMHFNQIPWLIKNHVSCKWMNLMHHNEADFHKNY